MCILVTLLIAAPLYLWIARYLLGPVFAAATSRNEAVRFQLSELAALMLYLSIALAVGTAPQRFGQIDERDFTVVLTGSLLLLSTCLWWIAVRTLSQARIHDARKRAAFLLIAVPWAYLSPIGVLVALETGFMWAINQTEPAPGIGLFAAGVALAVVTVTVCRNLSRWVATA
jgi:hypothetical protein